MDGIRRMLVLGTSLWFATARAEVSGWVRLPSGEGLPAVAVVVRGSADLRTTTDAQGRWSLPLEATSLRPKARSTFSVPSAVLDGRLIVRLADHAADGSWQPAGAEVAARTMAKRRAEVADTLEASLCGARAQVVFSAAGTAPIEIVLDTAGALGACDNAEHTFPAIEADRGFGAVTTYGGVDTTGVSVGGACNYGATRIRQYAAIQVNRLPGDGAGQWNGGRICGQGVRVHALTPSGWKDVVVRVVDKCPDAYCGIDLGGAPAAALMGVQAGRYPGWWEFVSAKGLPGLSDGEPRLWIKEGASAYWSLVQVRDPWTAVAAILWRPAGGVDGNWQSMPWATEADNFFKVPRELLALGDSVEIRVRYADSTGQSAKVAAGDFAREAAEIPLE